MTYNILSLAEKSPSDSKRFFHDLINDLDCNDQQRSHEAKKKLLAFGSTVVPDLVRLLPTASNKLRFRIIMILCETKDNRIIPDLLPYLQADNPTIQAIVAQFLGEFGDESTIEPLIGHLTQKTDANFSLWIIQALGRLRAKQAVHILIDVMHTADTGSTRYTAIEALGLIGDPTALNEISRYLTDKDHHVSDRARTAIDRINSTNHASC